MDHAIPSLNMLRCSTLHNLKNSNPYHILETLDVAVRCPTRDSKALLQALQLEIYNCYQHLAFVYIMTSPMTNKKIETNRNEMKTKMKTKWKRNETCMKESNTDRANGQGFSWPFSWQHVPRAWKRAWKPWVHDTHEPLHGQRFVRAAYNVGNQFNHLNRSGVHDYTCVVLHVPQQYSLETSLLDRLAFVRSGGRQWGFVFKTTQNFLRILWTDQHYFSWQTQRFSG